MQVTRQQRRWVYIVSGVITFVLTFGTDGNIARNFGQAIGGVLFIWGLPALSLWLATRKADETNLRAFIIPGLVWLFLFVALILGST
jgi:hypothetical protein